MPLNFEIQIHESGLIRTIYRLHIEKQGNPQLGISYLLPSDVENLAWKRSLLWCVYPTDQIGRPEGVAYDKATGEHVAELRIESGSRPGRTLPVPRPPTEASPGAHG